MLERSQSDGSYKVRINVSDHKAEAGEYIVHLYYVPDGKMVGIGTLYWNSCASASNAYHLTILNIVEMDNVFACFSLMVSKILALRLNLW